MRSSRSESRIMARSTGADEPADLDLISLICSLRSPTLSAIGLRISDVRCSESSIREASFWMLARTASGVSAGGPPGPGALGGGGA